MQFLRVWCKWLARLVVSDYSIYSIYALDVAQVRPATTSLTFGQLDVPQLESADTEVKVSRGYAGKDALGFALFDEGQPVCSAWFWYGDRYRERNFWPLGECEAKLVQIITSPSARGQGLAPVLLDYCLNAMEEKGFQKLYARIWFSNTSSIRAFRKARWRRVALVITLKFRGVHKEFRINIGTQPNADHVGQSVGEGPVESNQKSG